MKLWRSVLIESFRRNSLNNFGIWKNRESGGGGRGQGRAIWEKERYPVFFERVARYFRSPK